MVVESQVSKVVKNLLQDASNKRHGHRSRSGSLTHSPTIRRRPRCGSVLTETKRVSYIQPISDEDEDNNNVDSAKRTKEKINQYVIMDDLGRGTQGVVKKALDENTGQYYAIKMISKKKLRRNIQYKRKILRPPQNARPSPGPVRVSPAEYDEMKKEIAILKKLDHPNIVRCVEIMDDPEADNMYMVFELMENGCIMDVDERKTTSALAPEVARKVFVDLLLGIEYLHANRVIHRDIKPQNLLLDEHYDLHISDFGVSHACTSNSDLLRASAGSPAFLAPECLDADSNTYAGRPIDVWAMGVTLYCFMYGKVPFSGANILELHDNIRDAEADYASADDRLVHLLNGMLHKNPESRMTLRDVRHHPWITQDGAEPIQITEEANTIPVDVNAAEINDALHIINQHDMPMYSRGANFKTPKSNRKPIWVTARSSSNQTEKSSTKSLNLAMNKLSIK
eukprot:CFRG6235T1